MNGPAVSVIVVSRGRPHSLKRCLMALSQLYYSPFEIILVADAAGQKAASETRIWDLIKTTQFDDPNISVARNIGISMACGKIVAFIDDDALPEPGWLFHLIPPFDDADVFATTGFVRGKNGISFQTRAATVDEFGATEEFELPDDKTAVLAGYGRKAISTIGTNCAFRRSAFERFGGFDPGHAYFLDESDINMRLTAAGKKTAIVPLAEVHHSLAASESRGQNGMPTSLNKIGFSLVYFMRKHADASRIDENIAAARAKFHRSIITHMVRGHCEPGDVTPVMQTFDLGVSEGREHNITAPPAIGSPDLDFLTFPTRNARSGQVISGYLVNQVRLRSKARSIARSGALVSLYLFSRTLLFHKVRYDPDGYWIQTGGLFGKSVRSERFFSGQSLLMRAEKEARRVAKRRYPWELIHAKGD